MIPHNRPALGIAVNRVLTSDWVVQGVEVETFENDKFSTSTVSLPIYPSLNLQEISLISKVLSKIL